MPAAEEPASPWQKRNKVSEWKCLTAMTENSRKKQYSTITQANYLPNNGCNFATAARKIMGEKPNRGLPDFSKKCAQIGRQAWQLGIVSLFSHCQSAAAKPVVTWNPARTKPHRRVLLKLDYEQEMDFFSPALSPRGASPVLWITLLVERTPKACIKQGANKSNYGRLVGRRELGVSVWCGFSAHMPPRSEVRAGKASAFYGAHYIAQHTRRV